MEEKVKEPRKRRFWQRDPFDRDWYLRIRMTALMGLWGFLAFYLWSMFITDETISRILKIVAYICPVLGWFFYDILDTFVRKTFGGIFYPETGKSARAHSEGEALVQRKQFDAALDWFSAAVMKDPTDWRAQERVVEILIEHIGDRNRIAEERNRLLKMEGVPPDLWVENALELGRDWVELGLPDRAINTYKSILWKHDEGYDADEVRRRLAELGVKYE